MDAFILEKKHFTEIRKQYGDDRIPEDGSGLQPLVAVDGGFDAIFPLEAQIIHDKMWG